MVLFPVPLFPHLLNGDDNSSYLSRVLGRLVKRCVPGSWQELSDYQPPLSLTGDCRWLIFLFLHFAFSKCYVVNIYYFCHKWIVHFWIRESRVASSPCPQCCAWQFSGQNKSHVSDGVQRHFSSCRWVGPWEFRIKDALQILPWEGRASCGHLILYKYQLVELPRLPSVSPLPLLMLWHPHPSLVWLVLTPYSRLGSPQF